MRTFSKAWGLSGIRLGYMVSTKKICDYVSKCRTLVETNSLTFQVALWALKNKIYKNHVSDVKKGYKYIVENFSKSNEIFFGGRVTNAILLKLPSVEATQHLKNFLSKKKIYVRANFQYPIEQYVRISLASEKKMSIFFKEYKIWKKKYIENKLNA